MVIYAFTMEDIVMCDINYNTTADMPAATALPVEIWWIIFQQLDMETRVRWKRTCKYFHFCWQRWRKFYAYKRPFEAAVGLDIPCEFMVPKQPHICVILGLSYLFTPISGYKQKYGIDISKQITLTPIGITCVQQSDQYMCPVGIDDHYDIFITNTLYGVTPCACAAITMDIRAFSDSQMLGMRHCKQSEVFDFHRFNGQGEFSHYEVLQSFQRYRSSDGTKKRGSPIKANTVESIQYLMKIEKSMAKTSYTKKTVWHEAASPSSELYLIQNCKHLVRPWKHWITVHVDEHKLLFIEIIGLHHH